MLLVNDFRKNVNYQDKFEKEHVTTVVHDRIAVNMLGLLRLTLRTVKSALISHKRLRKIHLEFTRIGTNGTEDHSK